MIEQTKKPRDDNIQKIFDFVEQEEIEAIKKGIGVET